MAVDIVLPLMLATALFGILLPQSLAEMRCKDLCDDKVNFAVQCDICQNRKPVRFGKRSSSPEINVNVRGAAVLPSPHLLSLLLQRAAAESQSLAQDDGNDSTVQFQLNYQ